MTGVTKIDGKDIKLTASAGVLVLYKSQFGREYINDSKAIADAENPEIEDYVPTAYRLLWCMAKLADPTILPPDEWAESFRDFDLEEPLKKAQELFADSLKDLDDVDDANGTSEPLTVEKLIAYSALCGMTMADLDRLSLPLVLKTIYEYVRIKYGDGNEARAATQEDYDNF